MLCYVNTNLYSALGGTPSSYQLRFTIAAAKANHHFDQLHATYEMFYRVTQVLSNDIALSVSFKFMQN